MALSGAGFDVVITNGFACVIPLMLIVSVSTYSFVITVILKVSFAFVGINSSGISLCCGLTNPDPSNVVVSNNHLPAS